MFKSIFTKYFTVMMLIIMVSFTAMGGILLLFNSRYWVEDKKTLLVSNNQKVTLFAARAAYEYAPNKFQLRSDVKTHLENISEYINMQVFLTDKDGVVLYCSPGVEAYQGLAVAESIRALTDASDDGYWDVGSMEGLLGDGRYYVAGQPLRLADGRQLGYTYTFTPADELGAYLRENLQMFFLSAVGVMALAFIIIYLLTFTMVRPLRQMAATTRRFAQEDFSSRIAVKGRDEVAELAAAFNSMAVSLSSVEGMRRSFVANVSHELKTPMTTISGFIDGILDGTIPPDRQEHYLKIVTAEVKRLSRLVKSMLDLSRIDNGELKLKPTRFDLTEHTCNILLSFEQRIDQKGIEVTGLADCPPVIVSADYDLIGQVVYNLLDNAIKFIDGDGTLTIRIYRLSGRTYLSVRNTGPGIPAQEMPHIFERFYKTDTSRSLDKNGMGLGLYIVKTIITLHHGEIAVRSAQGQFCEFEFWLPDAEASH